MNTVNNNKDNQQKKITINRTISSTLSRLHQGTHTVPVYLNLYDLRGCINAFIHSIGLSYYHCALQIYSTEYGYMGHPYSFTGLYKTSKHDSRFHLYQFRQSIEVGWTCFHEKDIDELVNDLKPFYMGLDYHTTNKNSIHFAKYLLEQITNDPQLKHLKSIKIIDFPAYIDRSRRLAYIIEILQLFDREKVIAEINILYFLYMKYEGNIRQICRSLQFDTIEKVKRSVQLIEQGIQQKRLPIFSTFTEFELKTIQDYINVIDQSNYDSAESISKQLTLTDIFHQFDTITLRGRTSIDRYLNVQQAKELTPTSQQENNQQIMIINNNLADHHKEFDSTGLIAKLQVTNSNRTGILSKDIDSKKNDLAIEKSYKSSINNNGKNNK